MYQVYGLYCPYFISIHTLNCSLNDQKHLLLLLIYSIIILLFFVTLFFSLYTQYIRFLTFFSCLRNIQNCMKKQVHYLSYYKNAYLKFHHDFVTAQNICWTVTQVSKVDSARTQTSRRVKGQIHAWLWFLYKNWIFLKINIVLIA